MRVIITEKQYKIIRNDILNDLILENKQLADKVYFNTGKLSPEDKNFIYSISKGDYTTKLLCDMYIQMRDSSFMHDSEISKMLVNIHDQLINYNKNFFPIANFDINNLNNKLDYYLFDYRGKILNDIKELPSIALRNLRNEIREPRDLYGFKEYQHSLDYFTSQFSQLNNRDPELRNKIYQKMFKSNITLNSLIDFSDEKENLLGGKDFTKEEIHELVSDSYDMQIVYESDRCMVIDVESPEAIKSIGCNSLWCFTYGNGFEQAYRQWNNYSYNDHVYVIVDLTEPSNSPDFMHVLIKPLEKSYDEDNEDSIPLFNMANEQSYDPYNDLNNIFGKMNWKKIFKFD